jgi:hypothetical protein
MRHDVMVKTPTVHFDSVNAYMVTLFGDDPGTQEIGLNAYLAGADPTAATHSMGVANCSQADTDSLTAFLAALDGCDSAVYDAGSGEDYWAEAGRLWDLKHVQPVIP